MDSGKSAGSARQTTQDINLQIDRVNQLRDALNQASSPQDKRTILYQVPDVEYFINSLPLLRHFLAKADLEKESAILSLLAIGQGGPVFNGMDTIDAPEKALEHLAEQLMEVENFYAPIGGIVGYHLTFLKLVREQISPQEQDGKVRYYKPEGFDMARESPEVLKAIRRGIEALPDIAEIYPVGGAGDRLNLLEEATGKPRPAGQLPFLGQTLIALMIRDLQAREFLYYKLFGKQITTPVAMLTSLEKDNHACIQAMCQQAQWFGRLVDHYFLFIQPLVPVITSEGKWVVSRPLSLFLKPGGHGTIWKLAKDRGVFSWLHAHHRTKALIRQVNNPAAGIDYGLLALCGLGIEGGKSMGFASCERHVGAHEGMDILVEKRVEGGYEYGITNIEYTDFAARGIRDVAEGPGGQHSIFPANTNILFVDLAAIQEALKKCPIPGMLVNMKTPCPFSADIHAGRLESTMQNIADGMLEGSAERIKPGEQGQLKTFIAYNARSKTIVPVKKAYVPGHTIRETPIGCFYELQQNQAHLFRDWCGFTMPDLGTPEEYVEKGPGFLILFHPALGPLYRVIGQKIRQGSLSYGSEMQLEIAELDISQLQLEGSLLITAEDAIGHTNGRRQLSYSHNIGKCTLKNVQVGNKGIDRSAGNQYWKNQINRLECLRIHIEGSGEFYADNVHFEGDQTIVVPDGIKTTAFMRDGKLALRQDKIDQPTWSWHYHFDENDRIVLKREEKAR